ncbi:MAG: spondin domain-containing protein, partial [Verrucomicrobiales bacterium]|nr:spondin domain-containing protein [Verrucomicrobiales bacterium]
PLDRFFTYASMVIPSNDAFIGNGNPQGRPVFDAAGNFVGGSWIVTSDQVKDAGTEVNDELPVNTAFFGQTTANTGTAEGGTVMMHTGFKAKGTGGILDTPMFANADFKAANYQIARLTLLNSIYVSGVTLEAGRVHLNWLGGSPPYVIQVRSSLSEGVWVEADRTMEKSASVLVDGATGFFRVVSPPP